MDAQREQQRELSHHELAVERAPRPIWLPAAHEPVTLTLGNGEKLPARVTERDADSLSAAVIVPTNPSDKALRVIVLEHANPGGLVRLLGRTTVTRTEDGLLVRIDEPQLIEVVQERAHVRVNVRCAITLTATESGEVTQTYTADLSAGGALLADANVASVGDQLTFELAITAGQSPVRGTAEVARIDGQGRAGLYFVDLPSFERWRLIRFTLECQEGEHERHAEGGR
ncbi:MAG TPA: PilZ domain-containing protein [Solirubrobacteraceae bacterium]|nr:PilZ domain-containing protein [Solirubrobacteraceae bacterium]